MKDYRQLIKELPSRTVVMAFGRFNPPTIGHELLVKAVKKLAQQKRADHVIYASRSQDAKKNPLTVDKKVKYLNLMFKNTHFVGATDTVRTFIEAAKELNKKYKNLVMVAGSDRVPEFNRLLNTYNGKEFHFDTIEVISAGERDPDADDATGMSASKMRAIAVKGNYAEFKKGLPSSVREIDGRRLMNDIREGMGLESIKEQIILVKDELREKYFRGEIFNEGDIVESDGEKYTIVKRGSNHLLLKEESGALVSKWIQDVKPTEEKDMNEALTDKTLRPNDKLKVARIIATMLGIENAETSSNPENLINQALRRVRTKALNPEALHILDKMLNLATEQGIQYDGTLKPTKLKEAVNQIDGTDKITTTTDSPVVNTRSNYNIAKDVLRFNDFKKLKKIQEHEESDNDVKKDNESDHDHEHNHKEVDHSEVGHTLVGPGKQDNLRRRKVAYHLGEQHKIPHVDMTSYGDEAGHENTAQHVITSPEHTAKQKKLAKSFVDKMTGSIAEAVSARLKLADALRREGEKRKASEERAKLMLQQGREKQALADQHKKEKENLKTEEVEQLDELSPLTHARYRDAARKTIKDVLPHTTGEYGDIAKNIVKKRMAGLVASGKTELKKKLTKEEIEEAEIKFKNNVCEKCDKSPCECDNDSIDQTQLKPNFDPFFKEDEDEFDFPDPSDDEIEKMADELTDDDYLDAYEEDEMGVVDDESGEELEADDEEEKKLKESTLMEVLSRVERMKAVARIRRTKAKRERATKIALKRYSNTATINKRARRLAIKLMKKRLTRGRDPSKLSVGEKERIERIIQRRKEVIGRIAMRLAPRVRKVEKSRLSHSKYTQGSPNVTF